MLETLTCLPATPHGVPGNHYRVSSLPKQGARSCCWIFAAAASAVPATAAPSMIIRNHREEHGHTIMVGGGDPDGDGTDPDPTPRVARCRSVRARSLKPPTPQRPPGGPRGQLFPAGPTPADPGGATASPPRVCVGESVRACSIRPQPPRRPPEGPRGQLLALKCSRHFPVRDCVKFDTVGGARVDTGPESVLRPVTRMDTSRRGMEDW